MSNSHGKGWRSLLARLFSTALLLDIAILVAITYLALQEVGDQVRAGIVEGIAANLITTSAFTIVRVTAFIWLSVSQRRRLFRFCGISRRVLGVRIYLSQLQSTARWHEGYGARLLGIHRAGHCQDGI